MQASKKDDIIIQIGAQWLRMGLVGEKVPRKSLRSKTITKILKHPQNKQQNQMMMDELLCNIFFLFLNSSCQNKTVVLLQKVYTPRYVLQLMAKIMFTKLKIDKLEFSLSCVTPLYLTAKYTGIVISSGASCTEIMPIYEGNCYLSYLQGYPLFRNYVYVDGGTSRLNKRIRDQLVKMNPDLAKDIYANFTDQQLTDIKNNYATIPTRDKQLLIPMKKFKLKFNQNRINFQQLLFGNWQNEQVNLAHSFLRMLDGVPVECLDELCANVVFAGGLWRVDGMQNYFKKQLSTLLVQFQKLNLLEVRKKLSFVSWGFNPSEVSWIGCSIGASVRSVDHLCLKRAQFQEKNCLTEKIMQSYFLSN